MQVRANRAEGTGGAGLALGLAALLGVAALQAGAQEPLPAAPSALKRTALVGVPAGIRVEAAQPGAMPLSLDEAISLGLKHNVQIQLSGQQERYVRGQTLTVANSLLPSLQAVAYTQTQQINLAAMGFKPGSIDIPGFPTNFPTIVKVDTTSAQMNLSQALFNLPAYYLYRSAQKASVAAGWNTANVRGGVALAVGTTYLRTLADAAMIVNARARVTQEQEVLRHATESHNAGVGINLDVLRARVQVQNEQQSLIQAENTFEKDKIQLNRMMGIPAEQQLQLTDPVPFAEYTGLSVGEARTLAYTRRQDLLDLMAQTDVAEQARKAVKFERLPTLAVGGFYGVLGETTGLYHGNFTAEGSVRFPIFDEGELRGQREVAEAQTIALRHQVESLKGTIDAQIRSSMLDVQSSAELVKVARSNVELATQELADATMRYEAGVDDNLPVVRAQTALAGAQVQVIQNEFQYNGAKLQLARSIGVVETEYKGYLGR